MAARALSLSPEMEWGGGEKQKLGGAGGKGEGSSLRRYREGKKELGGKENAY